MVVPFSLILFLSFIITPYALEKRIKENWDRLAYPSKVYELYSLLGFRCLWFCDGKETENFHTLQEVFDEAVLHGIEINLDVEELAITDSLIKLAYSLYYGRVDPSTLYKRWNLPKKPDRVISGLSELIRQGRIRDLTVELSPQDEEYWFLVEKAKDFRDLSAFDWKPIKLRRTLSLGGRSPCIDEIRFRLFLLGDLERYEPSDTFDGELFEAVKGFQRRHGLPETGSIDARTLKELNILPAERLKMIYLNLEKRRWLHIPFVRYILVNVPSFEFFWVEGYELKLYSRVIVGRNYKDDFRPTPM
ncbi:MAG: peptidoglycan-binding protein, partial [Aquificaceae bacterium]